MAIYAAMIEEVDKNIGKLVAALQQRDQLDNTLILFLSDNGGNAESGVSGKYQGDHPGDPHSNVFIGRCWAHLNNTPFRKYKHYNHEGGIATPLIAHWPAAVQPRPGHDGWITTPTHLDRSDGDLRGSCGGQISSKRVTASPSSPCKARASNHCSPARDKFAARPLFWEHEGNAAIRVGDRKLVRAGMRGAWELFDLKADRTEQHNLADARPEEVQQLSRQWHNWAQQAHVLPKPPGKQKKQKRSQANAGTRKKNRKKQ